MKKTNKPNPLKVFNDNKAMAYKKAGGEMAAYKKSLKQFQGEGDSEVNMMIDKPGSTGGFKAPVRPKLGYISGRPGEGTPTPKDMLGANAEIMNLLQGNVAGPSASASARAAAIQGQGVSGIANSISKVESVQPPVSVYDKKRGGTVKTKKR
jgi:hypothetical protein